MALKAPVLSLLICSTARKTGSPGWAAGLLGTGACGGTSREILELLGNPEAPEGHSLARQSLCRPQSHPTPHPSERVSLGLHCCPLLPTNHPLHREACAYPAQLRLLGLAGRVA